MGDMEMPDWAPPDGPWCLHGWLPLPSGVPPKYVVCLLAPNHEGDCRDQFGLYCNSGNSLFLGSMAKNESEV